MLKTTIEDAGSENDTQSQKEAFQQIRREIATSSDITEQQQLQIIHDEEAERQKEEERIILQKHGPVQQVNRMMKAVHMEKRKKYHQLQVVLPHYKQFIVVI